MHIDKNDLIEFDNSTMNTQEVIEFLSHLDHCDSCLDQMIEQESHSLATAPSYLTEQILNISLKSTKHTEGISHPFSGGEKLPYSFCPFFALLLRPNPSFCIYV